MSDKENTKFITPPIGISKKKKNLGNDEADHIEEHEKNISNLLAKKKLLFEEIDEDIKNIIIEETDDDETVEASPPPIQRKRSSSFFDQQDRKRPKPLKIDFYTTEYQTEDEILNNIKTRSFPSRTEEDEKHFYKFGYFEDGYNEMGRSYNFTVRLQQRKPIPNDSRDNFYCSVFNKLVNLKNQYLSSINQRLILVMTTKLTTLRKEQQQGNSDTETDDTIRSLENLIEKEFSRYDYEIQDIDHSMRKFNYFYEQDIKLDTQFETASLNVFITHYNGFQMVPKLLVPVVKQTLFTVIDRHCYFLRFHGVNIDE